MREQQRRASGLSEATETVVCHCIPCGLITRKTPQEQIHATELLNDVLSKNTNTSLCYAEKQGVSGAGG